MRVETRKVNDLAILQLQGEFTADAVKTFDDAVSGALAGDAAGLVLDMSKVAAVDSAALEALLTLNDLCRQRTRILKLAGLDETCRKILEITRLLDQFDVYDECAQAVKSFG